MGANPGEPVRWSLATGVGLTGARLKQEPGRGRAQAGAPQPWSKDRGLSGPPSCAVLSKWVRVWAPWAASLLGSAVLTVGYIYSTLGKSCPRQELFVFTVGFDHVSQQLDFVEP